MLGPAATQAPGILLRKCSSTTLHDTTTASSNANIHMISRPDTPVSADCTQPQYREQKYAQGSTSSHSWRRPGSSHLSQACSLTSDASPGARGHAKRLQDRQILREHQCDGRFSAIMSFPCGKFNLTPTPHPYPHPSPQPPGSQPQTPNQMVNSSDRSVRFGSLRSNTLQTMPSSCTATQHRAINGG